MVPAPARTLALRPPARQEFRSDAAASGIGLGPDARGTRVKRLAFAAATAVLLVACASSPDVQTDFDAAYDFGRHRTYAWEPTPVLDAPPLVRQRITASIDAKLGAMGWTPAPAATAEVVIAAHVVTRERLSIDTFSHGGWGGWPLPPGNGSAQVRSHTVGTLVVDMFETRSRRAIWRGTASGALPKTTDKATAGTQDAIDGMFASFPGTTANR
jgi:hypothetical protein